MLKFKRYTGALYNNFPKVGQVVELVGNPVYIRVTDVTPSGSITGTILGTKAKVSVKFGEYKIVEDKWDEAEHWATLSSNVVCATVDFMAQK